jgi:predicted ATP-grasp superfamily ATP-dependent carboligase
VIIKPTYAHEPRARGVSLDSISMKAAIAESPRDAQEILHRMHSAGIGVYLQEYVPGPEARLFICAGYLRSDGECAAFTARKVFQHPPQAGIGYIVETTDQPELARQTTSFLKHLGFHGIFEAEYKQDSDGTMRLIEINPRHWDQHILGCHCGVNVSVHALSDHQGTSMAGAHYRYRSAIWYDDVFLLRLALSGDTRWRTIARRYRAASQTVTSEMSVFRLTDPFPAIICYSLVLRDLAIAGAARIRAKLSRRLAPSAHRAPFNDHGSS